MQITFESNVVVDFELNFKSHSKFISFDLANKSDAAEFLIKCLDEATSIGTNAFEDSVYGNVDTTKCISNDNDEDDLSIAINNVLMYYDVDLGCSDFVENAIVQKVMKIDVSFGENKLHFNSANSLYEFINNDLEKIFNK